MRKISSVVLVANNIGGLGGISALVRTQAAEFSRRGYEVLLLGFDKVDGMVDMSGFRSMTVFDSPTPRVVYPKQVALGRLDPRVQWSHLKLRRLRARGSEHLQPILAEFDSSTALICTQVFGMEQLLAAGLDPMDRNGPLTFGQHHASFAAAKREGFLPRLRTAYRGVDRFVALTDADAQDFQLAGLPDVTAIPNPVALPPQTPDPSSRTVVAIGRLAPEKRLDRLLHAWSRVHGDHPDWRLQLWGAGEEEDAVRGLIDDLDLQATVSMMGATDDVPGVLATAAVMTLSSDEEGLPLAIAEAARAGVPTVSVDCAPGIRELIADGVSGIVTPPRSAEGLAAGLDRLMSDAELRRSMGAAAQQKSLDYLPEAIIDRWEAEFARALR